MDKEKNRIQRTIVEATGFKLVITPEFEAILDYMSARRPDKEWSGILFYDVEGSIETKDLVLTTKDIYLMDLGNAAYTSFEITPELVSYMSDNDLFGCQQGLIHSHHSMSTTFSGTDHRTLDEEGIDRTHFLSLIVNNAKTYSAKLTQKIDRKAHYTINVKESYNTFDDSTITYEPYIEEAEETDVRLVIYPLEIIMPAKNDLPKVAERYEELSKKDITPYNNYKPGQHYNYNRGYELDTALQMEMKRRDSLPRQGDLFEDELVYKTSNRPTPNDEIVVATAFTIIAGTPLAQLTNGRSITDAVKAIIPHYDRVFTNANNSSFLEWVDTYVPYIISTIEDTELLAATRTSYVHDSILAGAIAKLIADLNKALKNPYLEVIVECLLREYNYD
jgi:hypothetical protein